MNAYENNIPYPINELGVGWDGTFDGEIMNPAVFLWSLEVEYIDGARGHINETLDVSSNILKSYAREARAAHIE